MKNSQSKSHLWFTGLLSLLLITSCSKDSVSPIQPTPPDSYSYQVIEEFPHRQDAFTQGLQYLNGFLYESTGLYGRSSLRKVELRTGKVLDSLDVPRQYFAEGLTIFQNRIFQLTWRSFVGFIYRLDDFALVDSFTYSTEGWGLTNDQNYLIMSDGSDTIRFMEPQSFQVTHKVGVTWEGTPVTRLNELEYINGRIYANVWQTDYIVVISPQTGVVDFRINLNNLLNSSVCSQPIDVLNGIAYDATEKRLLVTGKFWCKLFHIELVPQ
jgi:glutamine cyclotransferase